MNLYQFENSSNISEEYYNRIKELSTLSAIDFSKELSNFQDKIAKFQHATEIGSVIDVSNITPDDIKELRQFINVFDEFVNMDILYLIPETHERLNNVLDIMEVMVNKYAAVVTNPPYLNKMSNLLGDYVVKNYKDVKTDMFSVFIKMNSNLLVKDGYAGFMTPFVWMFIKSYEQLRNYLIQNKSISSLIQMEYSAFEEATVPVCCFTIKNSSTEPIGNYFKLSDFRGGMKIQEEKVLEGIQDPSVDYFYQTNQQNFEKIPGSPISFWVSERLMNLFSYPSFEGKVVFKEGITTANNNLFLRYWYEINDNSNKWIPYNKGGSYRKWYGNNDYVINWEKNGELIKNYPGSSFRNVQYQRQKIGGTFSALTSGKFSARKSIEFAAFDSKGTMFFSDSLDQVISYMNSNLFGKLLSFVSPTLDYRFGTIQKLPLLLADTDDIAESNIDISEKDYNLFEISKSFRKHPLL